MKHDEAPVTEFERHRDRLEALAGRMLGSAGEAEEIVQEAWLRFMRTPPEDMRTLGAWLTTVVTRLCVDELRTRRRRSIEGRSGDGAAINVTDEQVGTPERHAQLADSVGVAMLVVLERLNPAERVAFVLHDLFDLPFGDIAPLIEKSEEATRQLASRARRRIRGVGDTQKGDLRRHIKLAEAFLAVARSGDLPGLLRLLAPDAAIRPDLTAARLGPGGVVLGADKVARFLIETGASAAHVALIDGAVGLIVAPHGRLLLAIKPVFRGNIIAAFDVVADPDALAALILGIPEGAAS